MTKKWKKLTAKQKSRPSERTSKLQKKPSALKREHPALQNIKFLDFILLLWVIFALLDLDPNPDSESGYGSTDLIESGSEALLQRLSSSPVASRADFSLPLSLPKIPFVNLLYFMCENLTMLGAHFHIQFNLEKKRSPAKFPPHQFDYWVRGTNRKDQPKKN
jgi:hypothetical protein